MSSTMRMARHEPRPGRIPNPGQLEGRLLRALPAGPARHRPGGGQWRRQDHGDDRRLRGTHAGYVAPATLSLAPISAMLGEVTLPQRALQSGVTLVGPLEALLMIENLGVFRDLPLLPGWLYIHVPGWETTTARLLLAQLAQVPAVHFGDLDPNGVRIFQHLRQERPDLRWFVPPFWADYMTSHALPTTWPADLDLSEAPGLIRELAHQGLWLEQEPLAIDPRTLPALHAMIQQ